METFACDPANTWPNVEKWIMPTVSSQQAYKEYMECPDPTNELEFNRQQEVFRIMTAWMMIKEGKFLLDSAYMQNPTRYNPFKPQTNTAAEASQQDLDAFLQSSRVAGQSAHEFGAAYLNRLDFLIKTSDGRFAPPVRERQPRLLIALGGNATALGINIMGRVVPELSLAEIVERVHETDMRVAAGRITSMP